MAYKTLATCSLAFLSMLHIDDIVAFGSEAWCSQHCLVKRHCPHCCFDCIALIKGCCLWFHPLGTLIQGGMEPPPKRLRGWQAEMAHQVPCEKEKPTFSDSSPLCTRLLELWAVGKISAKQAAEISHLALLEGCSSSDILCLAKCGNFGQNVGSCHRDMVNLFCKKMTLCEPLSIPVDMLDPNTREVKKENVSFFPPHLVFSNLAEHYSEVFERLFCFQEADKFWKNVEHLKDGRLAPPLALDKRVSRPSHTCPLFIHGDGAEFQSRDSLMTWSWGSLLSSQHSLASHILLASIPKSCTVATTWSTVDDWLAWSFSALVKGQHPDTDPYGAPLVKGLAEKAGAPLTPQGHRAAVWSIQGDQEFFANTLKLGHWSQKFPCYQCDGQRPMTKGCKCPEGKSIKLLLETNQNYQFVTPQAALLEKRSSHPVFSIPGVSSAFARGDSLHIIYSRGVASHLAGSLLFYLCYYDGPGTKQKVSPTLRLQKIFARIKEVYVEAKVSCRLTNLRLTMFCDPAKPHKNYPVLEAKAAETKHLLPCLLQVLQEVLPAEEPIHGKMQACLASLVSIAEHYDACGMFLTHNEFKEASNLAKRFFESYNSLQQWALVKGQKLFHVTWKFHSFMHLIKESKFLNYRCHSCYKAEHFVGQVSVLAHSCSFGVKPSKLSEKVFSKYRLLLHLQLCRPGFGHVDHEEEEP